MAKEDGKIKTDHIHSALPSSYTTTELDSFQNSDTLESNSKYLLRTGHSSMSAIIIPCIFVCFTIYLYVLSVNGPALNTSEEEKVVIRFPRTFDDLKVLSVVLQRYRDINFGYVLLLFCSAYIYKQTFALPGNVLMNLLGGALFGVALGFPLCCLLTVIGGSICYSLIYFFARDFMMRCCHKKIILFQTKVEAARHNLFFMLLFMRMVPMSPNWLINIASPIVNVPKKTFFFSLLFGLMPLNFISIQTGSFLSQLNSLDDFFTLKTLASLSLVACVAGLAGLIIGLVRRKIPQAVIE